MTRTPVIYTCDDHSAVYHHLIARGEQGLALSHLDAHCDLRGTLVDRVAGRAHLLPSAPPPSASTYLSHLVASGVTSDVEWVHDEVGGRMNDLGTVLYAEDLAHPLYRFVRRPTGPGRALLYRETDYAAFRHREPARVLDIDWDFFADFRKDPARIRREVDQLVDEKIEAPPERTFVAYSSEYSRPGIEAYRDFVDRLARRLAARVEVLPEAPPSRGGVLARALPPPVRRLLRGRVIAVKRLLLRR
jgi:hypothetical protein